ncbi:MAG: HAD family hydrolase [Spirochaetales bacterium]|jgi:hydrogenase expression/formation protein HypE|nr:HAD family hydrolase [Spirochaetales bacterium]
MNILAVLFDFDDTLTVPGKLDYQKIRADIGCPENESILDHLNSIDNLNRRKNAAAILHRHEMNAAAKAAPAPGAEALISRLKDRDLGIGILTRNSRAAVNRSLENFKDARAADFGIIVTRDDDIEVKPSPEGVLAAAGFFNIAANQMLVVGDYIYDIEAGNAAGAVTVFIDVRKDKVFTPPASAYTITHLREILQIISE